MAGVIEACAAIVERDDPHLHATALFAPEPARARLMVLYAFDCELSRATRASAESMIPRMRLQWWRDVVASAASDAPAPAHEVAGPLVSLIRSDPALLSDMADLPGEDVLSRMVRGHEAELETPFETAAFEVWANDRFGARLGLAGSILPMGPEFGHVAECSPAAHVLGLGFALRNAARMATTGKTLLPGLAGADLAALGRGELTDGASARIRQLAQSARAQLGQWRKRNKRLAPLPLVAHLPVRRELRVLRRVLRDPAAIFGEIDNVDRPFAGLVLAWRVWRGRW